MNYRDHMALLEAAEIARRQREAAEWDDHNNGPFIEVMELEQYGFREDVDDIIDPLSEDREWKETIDEDIDWRADCGCDPEEDYITDRLLLGCE